MRMLPLIIALGFLAAAIWYENTPQLFGAGEVDVYGVGIVAQEGLSASEFAKLTTTFTRKNGTDTLGATSYTYQDLPVRLFILHHPLVTFPNNIAFNSAVSDTTPTTEEMYQALRSAGITTYIIFDSLDHPQSFLFTHMPL